MTKRPVSKQPSRATSSGRERRLPDKLYFRIGEAAGIVGVEPHVLRYWEREFKGVRPTKSAKGQRVYSRRDLLTLIQIRGLLYDEGYTIAGARKRLAKGADAAGPPEPPRAPGFGGAGSGEADSEDAADDDTRPDRAEPGLDAVRAARDQLAHLLTELRADALGEGPSRD